MSCTPWNATARACGFEAHTLRAVLLAGLLATSVDLRSQVREVIEREPGVSLNASWDTTMTDRTPRCSDPERGARSAT
jgi:hypothetical protein